MKESTLTRLLKWGVYLCALVPLIIFSQFISPFHFGKVIVFRSIVELMVVFYLILIFKDRAYVPKPDKMFWAFLAFTLAFIITTLTSSQVYQSFWGTLERMGGLWTFWHYFLFFVILISVFRKREDWMNLFKVMVGVGILSALYGFGQKTNISFFIGGGDRARIFGTIGNAALFAGYQLLILFLSLTLFFKKGISVREKWFYGSGVILCAIAVMMTAVRGSILALGLGIILFAFLYFWNFRPQFAKKFTLYSMLALAALIILVFSFKNTGFVQHSPYLKRVTDFSLTSFTVQTRLWAWQAGLKGWASSFKTIVFGWGPENFNIPFSINFNPKFFTGLGAETLFDRAHNMFVEVWVTMGLLGLFAYLSLFVSVFWTLWKRIKAKGEDLLWAIGLSVLVLAYIIHNAFIFDTSANFITFFMVLGFIYFLKENNSQATQKTEPQKGLLKKSLLTPVSVALFVVVIILIYRTNVLPSIANYTTTRAIVAGWPSDTMPDGDFVQAVKLYQDAVSYNVPGKYEIRNRFAQYLLDTSIKHTDDLKFFDAVKIAIQEEDKNANDFPIDYLPQLYLSRLNIVLARNDPKSPYEDEALKHSMRALELSPTFIRTYYEIAQAYMDKQDLAKASEYFKKAIDLNPNVVLSYWYYGMVEFNRGNYGVGLQNIKKALDMGFTGSEVDYSRLVNVFLKTGDYSGLKVAYKGLIAVNPKNAQYHASLAVVYAKLGEIDSAVYEAKQAAANDPSFEAEAKYFVQGLGRTW